MRDKKLQFAFAVLILLTVTIGITGILQVQRLSWRVEGLGRRNLKIEKAVLEMRVNNTIYAMGIRNYATWKISRYLGAVPMAVNLDKTFAAAGRFIDELKIYEAAAYLPKQKEWAAQVRSFFLEFSRLGGQIISMANMEQTTKTEGAISNVLMNFDSHLYKIDEFLNNTMGKANLEEIEEQLTLAELEKNRAIALLALILLSAVGAGALIASLVYRRLGQERKSREGLFSQMINIEETERRNLSTAVHDQMGQDLSGLKIYLGLIEQELQKGVIASSPAAPRNDAGSVIASERSERSNPEAISLKVNIEQCKKVVSGLIDKSHNIAFLLRPPDLDEVGLVESLESLILEYKHLSSINYNFRKPVEPLSLPPQYSLLLYRISQELLTNMVKHAQAKNVEISLNKNNNNLEFIYRDDGGGFDYPAIEKQPRRRKEDKLKLGLSSLMERVKLLDGSMEIDTAPNRGTRIVVTLPV